MQTRSPRPVLPWSQRLLFLLILLLLLALTTWVLPQAVAALRSEAATTGEGLASGPAAAPTR